METLDSPTRPEGGPRCDIARLVADLRGVLDGEPSAGALIHAEIERAVAVHLYNGARVRLPDSNSSDPRHRAKKPAGARPDSTTPRDAWNLCSDFQHDYLFDDRRPQIYRILTRFYTRDCGAFGGGLKMLLHHYLWQRIHMEADRGLADNLTEAIGERLQRDHGLVCVSTGSGVHSKYWSQQAWAPDQLLVIYDQIDVLRGLDRAKRDILSKVEPIYGDDERRLKSGYGDESRDALTTLICTSLTGNVTDCGEVTFVPAEALQQAVHDLVQHVFPELLSDFADQPPGSSGGEGDEGEDVDSVWDTGKARHQDDPAGHVQAAEAVLTVMEELTLRMPAKTPRGISGAKVKRTLRLFASGATYVAEAWRTWQAVPREALGSRTMDLSAFLESYPCPDDSAPVLSEATRQRCAALLQAFIEGQAHAERQPPGIAPTQPTIDKWRACGSALWDKEVLGLDAAAVAQASRWFNDLLFLETGCYPPSQNPGDDAASADGDDLLAIRTATEAAQKLARMRATVDDRRRALLAIRAALGGVHAQAFAGALAIDRESAALVCAAGPDEAESKFEELGVLPAALAAGHNLFLQVAQFTMEGCDAVTTAARLGVGRATAQRLANVSEEVVSRAINRCNVPADKQDAVRLMVAELIEEME